MARGDDDLSMRFDVEGSGSAELDNIRRKLRDLGAAAAEASQKQTAGTKSATAGLRDQLEVETQLAQAIAKVERAASQTRMASNRVVASNATTAATASTAGPRANASVQLAQERAITEQVRNTTLAREQQNRDLIAQSRLLTEQEKQQTLIQSRTIAGLREEERQRRTIAQEEQRAATAAIQAETRRARAVTDRQRTERSSAVRAERNAAAMASPDFGSERRISLQNEQGSIEQSNALRYALYDVSQTALIVGGAITAIGTASIVAAAQGEQAFADLSAKFSDTDGDLSQLNASLLDLSTKSPANLSEVVGVAQLGAQMNVAKNDLDEFTKVITQFSATTDVTSEQAAESFGRISQLLKVSPDQFKNLSSAIFQVGVDSVATESQILKTSEEIAGSAAAYGFTADQVVGLSGAFASLAIQPEQARGATTRIFNNISSAVQAGGPKLQNYARIMHLTSQDAADLFKQDPSRFFDQLVHGLQDSGNRLEDLRSIGATGVFDNNVLNRLADNADFLTKSLATSKDAYDKGTAASEAFKKTTDTLIAQVKELGNTLVALGVKAGAPLVAALKPIVEIIKFIVAGFAQLPAPVLAFLAALTLAVGGFILFKGAVATTIAAVIGLRFVLGQLAAAGAESGVSMTTLRAQVALLGRDMGITSASSARLTGTIAASGAAATTASVGQRVLAGAMRAVPYAIGITLGLSLAQSLIQTHLAAQQAADGLRKVQDATGQVSTATLVSSFRTAIGTVREFQDEFNGRSGFTDQINAQINSFFNQFIDASPKVNNATREIKAIDAQLSQMVSGGKVKEAAAVVAQLGLSADDVASRLPNYQESLRATGEQALKFGADNLDAAGQLNAYDQALQDAKDSTDQLFGSLNQGSDFGASIQQLFSGIYDSGNAFGVLSETGRTNLANLQDAMTQTAAYAQSTGANVTDSLALVFSQLQKGGVDTAGLLKLIVSQPYVFSADLDITAFVAKVQQLTGSSGQYAAATKSMDNPTLALAANMQKLATTAPRAATGISKTEKAAKKAAKEVKTLNDYASDLNTVFSDATQYRFGVSDALDDIAGKWADIRKNIQDHNTELAEEKKQAKEALADYKEKVEDARQSVRGLRADLLGLQSDLTQKRYFLSIAVQYGDSLRGQELSADIVDLNSQIAEKQRDVNKAQKDATTPYEDTTKQIDFQQASLGDLYDSYQKAIVEYARSGLTQDQLAVKVNELRADFVNQARQAGYSQAAINKYSNAFNDLTVAIRGVPRKITVSANTDPAQRALRDFLAKANAAKADPNVGAGSGAKARQNGIQAGNDFTSGFNDAIKAAAVKTSIDALSTLFGKKSGKVEVKVSGYSGGGKFAAGGFIPGKNAFPVGGYVPGLTPSDRRRDNVIGTTGNGVVSLQGGEPIMTNAARSKYGDAMFDQINALRFQPTVIRPQVTIAGGGSGYTELSPTDRALLMEIARSANLSIASSALEKAVGASNTASSRRRAG